MARPTRLERVTYGLEGGGWWCLLALIDAHENKLLVEVKGEISILGLLSY
jgi:hypothetical protein